MLTETKTLKTGIFSFSRVIIEYMLITVVRNKTSADGTFGVMSYGDGVTLVSLEKPWNNGDNHPLLSCIPAGTYEVMVDYSPHLEIATPILLNVPNRTQIRIHPANWQTQLQGCIAVGETEAVLNGTDGVSDSRKAFDALMTAINAASDGVVIQITNSWS